MNIYGLYCKDELIGLAMGDNEKHLLKSVARGRMRHVVKIQQACTMEDIDQAMEENEYKILKVKVTLAEEQPHMPSVDCYFQNRPTYPSDALGGRLATK